MEIVIISHGGDLLKLVLPVIYAIIWIVYQTNQLLGFTGINAFMIKFPAVFVLIFLAFRIKALHKTIPWDWGIPLLIMLMLIFAFLPSILRLL